MDLDHFYFDNIDFKLFDLALILITYILKASEWKQDSLAEKGGMIQGRLLSLIFKNLDQTDFAHFDLNHLELDHNILITLI